MTKITMTDGAVVAEMQTDSLLNRVRRVFSAETARLEQAEQQRSTPTPIERKRMEFEAAKKILDLIVKI